MELRKDYILDRWVLVGSNRSSRPHQYASEEEKKEGVCYFCPGNENLTPEEIGRIGNWTMRWFENKFPAVAMQGQADPRTDNDFFTFARAYGVHEIIAETPNHDEQVWDFSNEKIRELLKVYKDRINAIESKENIAYTNVFKNHGSKAGASIKHSHTQLIGTAVVPQVIADEAAKSQNNGCQYCRIINVEKNSDRRCFENNSFVAFVPYAARFNYEIWVFPKNHASGLDEFNDEQFSDLAEIMQKILKKLKFINATFNYFLHYSPRNQNMHFHIEVTPRMQGWAGFELSTGIVINNILPEDAASFYRE